MPPETVRAECKNGHEHDYAAPAGRAVKCKTAECRVSLGLRKGLPASEVPADESVWADETPWQGSATQAGEQAAELCGECGSVQHWTPGRTALQCSECDTVSLPLAVRESAAQVAVRSQAARVSTAVALPLTPEQELDALIRFEARQNSTVSVLRDAAKRLVDPAAYLEDQGHRKQAADTASALGTLARVASQAKGLELLVLVEEKAASLADSVHWFERRLEIEEAQEAEVVEVEYEDNEDEDEPRALAPSSALPSTSIPRTSLLHTSLPRGSYGSITSNAYTPLTEETARKRRENEAARTAAPQCEGKHRTLRVFPYHPKVQYRLYRVTQNPYSYAWDGNGIATRTHVMDGCHSCMQKAAGDEPGMEYVKLWEGTNQQMSTMPIGILFVALCCLGGLLIPTRSDGYGYDRW
jgi:hypothetical protein